MTDQASPDDGCRRRSTIMLDVLGVDERTRVARAAVATLRRLHDAMQRMQEWREDSVRLKSSIRRMRMDLQTDDSHKLEQRGLEVDPLIAHQRVQIGRLQRANDDLGNQVTGLKRALGSKRAEGENPAAMEREMGRQIARIEEGFAREKERLNEEILRLRSRLKKIEGEEEKEKEEEKDNQVSIASPGHHAGDELAGVLAELARSDQTIEVVLANTIGRTVGTLVGLSEELVCASEELCRCRTKNRQLRVRLDRLGAMLRTRCGGATEYRKRISELSNLAARLLGEMDRLRVIGKDASHEDVSGAVRQVERLMNHLRSNLKNDREALMAAGDPDFLTYARKVVDLRVNLRVLAVNLRRSNEAATIEHGSRDDRCSTISLVNDFLQRVDLEVGRLRVQPMQRYCRIGGASGARFTAKIAELEGIVKRSMGAVAALKLRRDSSAGIANTGNDEEATAKLADSIDRLCGKLKDLEVLDDGAGLRDRIDRLEATVTRLTCELTARDERVRALSDEHARISSSLQLERARHEGIVAEIRAENESLRERCARRAADETRLMKGEIEAARRKLRDLHADRDALSRDAEGMRVILRGRDKEIGNVIAERDRLEAELAALRTELEMVAEENAQLKSALGNSARHRPPEECSSRPDEQMKRSSTVGGREGADAGRDNGEGARSPLDGETSRTGSYDEPGISLDERIEHLRRALDKAVGERARRLEGETVDLKSNEHESSTRHRSDVRPNGCCEVTAKRQSAENKGEQVQLLRDEEEQLAARLSQLKTEREELLARIRQCESERNKLREELDEHLIAAEKLKSQLADAGVEAARLRAESGAESLRRGGAEERARILSAGRSELAARIDELNGASVGLRERLSKAEAENAYFSIELNKSRLGNDRARTRNALLHVTCDKRERDNRALRRGCDDARGRLNLMTSHCRILANQLAIQRIKYGALRYAAAELYHAENNARSGGHLKKIDTRHTLAGTRGRRSRAAARNDVKRKRDYPDAARADVEQLGDARAARIKDELMAGGELKSLPAGSLVLERRVARSGTEPARKRSKLEVALARTEVEADVGLEIVRSVLGGREAVDVVHRQKGTSDYPSYRNGDPLRSFADAAGIDQLEVENAALKMELDILRGSLDGSLMAGERTKSELGRASEEIQALRLELANLRDERAALRSRHQTFKEGLDALATERAALKDELAATRRSNLDLQLRANHLPAVHERLLKMDADPAFQDRFLRDGGVDEEPSPVVVSGISQPLNNLD